MSTDNDVTSPDSLPIPYWPPWCLEPAGHHTPTHVRGDWVRFHVAYQESFSTSAGEVEVEVAEHEFWEAGVLHHEPAQLNVLRAEWLCQVDALRLREMVGQATANAHPDHWRWGHEHVAHPH